jgi:ABC-2 type transport system ATP-binding protein
MSTVIKTDKLTKRFGDFIAANEITLEVEAGEIFGFLGANGAGKTTAMVMWIVTSFFRECNHRRI